MPPPLPLHLPLLPLLLIILRYPMGLNPINAPLPLPFLGAEVPRSGVMGHRARGGNLESGSAGR